MRQSKSKRSSQINLDKKQLQKSQRKQITIDKTWKQGKIDIVLHHQSRLGQTPKILKNVNVYYFPNQSIVAGFLIQFLLNQKQISEQNTLSYYLKSRNAYIFGMIVPNEVSKSQNDEQIDAKFIQNQTLIIKVREKKKIIIQTLVEQQQQRYQQTEEDKQGKTQKQKKIGEVIEKVALWRKFYTGFYDQSGNYIQKQLDAAAQDVGIAKKTLDDYLLQIRNGKKYGFNFNQKFNAKIGELRAFVRDEKRKQGK